MVDICPCCAPPWVFQQSPMAIAFVGIYNGTISLSVYNVSDGQLRWRVPLNRHASGSGVTANSCCFGLNQSVFAMQREIYTTPSFFSNYYLYEFDRGGNFVAETVLGQYVDLSPYGNLLDSNNLGQVVYNNYVASPRTYGDIYGGAALISPVTNLVNAVIRNDDSGYVYTYDGTQNIYRWDSAGTYIETLARPASSGNIITFDVAPDGTYLWRAASDFNGVNYSNIWKKQAIPGGAVLSTATSTTATRLTSVCITEWGSRLDAYDFTRVTSGTQGGLQVTISGTTVSSNLPGVSPSTVTLSVAPSNGGNITYGSAVSID